MLAHKKMLIVHKFNWISNGYKLMFKSIISLIQFN